MTRLYVAISHFHSALFEPNGPNGDDYSHDADATFVVVQPFLVDANHPDHIPPEDYFASWNVDRLEQTGFVLIDEQVARQLHGTRMIPVPFPKNTNLKLTLKGNTRSGAAFPDWWDDRVVGGTTPLGMPVTEFDQLGGDAALGWPGFAVLSQAMPLVEEFADLDARSTEDGPQKRAVVAALFALFSQMIEEWSAAPPGLPANDARVRIWTAIVEPQYRAHPLSDTSWWRTYLGEANGGSARIGWAYRLLIEAVANGPVSGKVSISVPRYPWDATLLSQQAGLFLDTGHLSGRSYLDAMWCSLADIGKREPAKLEGTLQRLFGFGERLAWPMTRVSGSVQHAKRFMTLSPSLSADAKLSPDQKPPSWIDPSAWLVTNMVSLLGLVFRITPFDPDDPPTQLTTADLIIAGHAVPPSADLAGALNIYFAAIARDAASGVKPNVSLAIAQERGAQSVTPAKPERLVLFAAREANLAALDASAHPAGRSFAAFGEALLDLVDGSARFSGGGPRLLPSVSAPRRGLFHSELAKPLPAGALTWQRRIAEIEPRPLTGAANSEGPAAYALRFSDALHPAEAQVATWLDAITSGGTGRQAFLWIPTVDAQQTPQPTTEVTLSAANLRIDVDGSLIILDPNPAAAGSLAKLLAARPGLPGGSKDPRVTIVFSSQGATDPFDLVEGLSDKFSIVLAKAPASRLGLTSDRLALALEASWSPGYDPDGRPADGTATPLVDQIANTNKLRLMLNTPGGYIRALSLPDALLPLPFFDPHYVPANPDEEITNRPWHRRGMINPDGPQAYYWLGEYFDHSSGSDERLEATRFHTWSHAGGEFSLSGYFEHQYGHRVAIPEMPLEMRRGVDIINPAQVHLGAPPTMGKSEGQRLTLVEAREIQLGTETKLQVGLRKDAATQALARYAAKSPVEDFAADLRTLYRALAELRDAIHARSAFVEIEQWVFDNSSAIGVGKGATLTQGLSCVDNTTMLLEPPAPGSALARMFAALDRDLTAFCTELEQVVQTSPDNWWAQLCNVPVTKAVRRASVLRVGLLLQRPEAVNASPEWAKGAFIPVAEDGGSAAGTALANVAQQELAGYLASSRLTSALDWIFVPATEVKTPVLGAGASTMLVPEAPTQRVQRVVDLFYMPHAFVLPAAHCALGDRQASFDFASFLLTLLEDVLSSRSIADRVELATLTADAAVRLRRRLRLLLEQKNGITDHLMRMFRRVDIAEPTPPADQPRALHWHAGALLDKLETLEVDGAPSPDRPSAAIREMIIDRPSLYASTRAISIVPFNTHLDHQGSDPAAPFNHDCFSPELLSLDLKKLLVGDDGTEAEDTTRFDLRSLRGGMIGNRIYAYVIDVLPDRTYDDTVVIGQNVYRGIDPNEEDAWGVPRGIDQIESFSSDGQSGVFARRGEDAIDRPRTGEPRGIAANVVHVFPSWRVLERDANGVSRKQAYYLLPERRMPPLARAVPMTTLDGKDASQSMITLNLPALSPAAPLPRVKLREAWSPVYDNATASLDALQVAMQGGGEPRVYRRILPSKNPKDPATRALPTAKVAGAEAGGWHLLTTVLANFYFAIDLQKSKSKLVEQLDDDVYEIEVEMWRKSPPVDSPGTPDKIEGSDKLLNAYRRMRALKTGTPAEVIPAVTEDELVNSLSNWLAQPPSDGPYHGAHLLEAPILTTQNLTAPALTRKFRIGRSAQAGGWQIKSDPTNPSSLDANIVGALGAVVGFEVLAQVAPSATKGPAYDAVVPDSERSAVIRLSVLDHPFHITRARMRIVRNWTDVDGDGKPDINPAFVLASGYSEWACEGRTPRHVDAALLNDAKMPDMGRELRVVPAGAPPETSIREWLEKIDMGGTFDAGAALPAMLNVPVFIDVDDGDKSKSIWESDWMTHDGFTVSATLNRTLVDLSARYGKSGTVFPIPAREVTTVRQICSAVPGGTLDKLLGALQPAEIMTLDAWTRVSWRDTEGHSVLNVDVPITFKSR
ncbi:hypothetical protein SAMN05216248_1049 [Pseudomonas simiae]|uniref:hypothetical protein n=1 Tax=Pseudomonas simiae TaxID=321846 RepID=UPI00084D631A|nr:hypothetical protein [Pseudomonas simiae]SFB27660.1 hypothetical protein SAMN05216248_1049 [Pseudomonas simiae]